MFEAPRKIRKQEFYISNVLSQSTRIRTSLPSVFTENTYYRQLYHSLHSHTHASTNT